MNRVTAPQSVPWLLRLAAATLLAALPLLVRPAAALAHPLGNFTVNRYSRVEFSPGGARVRYVLDMAEIPTFQALASLDAGGGAAGDAALRRYASQTFEEIARRVRLTVDGTAVPLRLAESEAALAPGQGGLRTLRLAAWFDAPAAAAILARAGERGVAVDFHDDNDPQKIGWREVVVRGDGVAIAGVDGDTSPAQDVSDELRVYPDDLLASPLDVRQARFSVLPAASGGTFQDARRATPPPARGSLSISRAGDGLAALLTQAAAAEPAPGLLLLALATAAALGGVHALSPGHGKTIVGAYLVGSRGTARHALFLGGTVTVVHTAGVFALGLATLWASRSVVPEQVYPWMSLASGVLVLTLGVSLGRARWRAGYQHSHDHGHMPDHTHAVLGADGAPVTWRSLLALGVSGGLLPCPSALVVMLGAIALHRTGLGLLLIVAFSAGLAATLMAIGLAMVYSGRIAGRLRLTERFATPGRRGWPALRALARVLPVASAAVVALAGLALSLEAARQIELPAVPAALTHPSLGSGGTLGIVALLGTALVLGIRHGIDWDHIAAITDITSSPPSKLPALGAASLYALGHALVVMALGLAALCFGAILPGWVDPIMERVVGLTLLALGGWVLYSLVRCWRGGGEFRLRSRWMLLFAAARTIWQRVHAWVHGHGHDGSAHARRVDEYGPRMAFGVGVIHGIGAETGTQVLIIAAVGGAASQGLGLWMLVAFVVGLLTSNTAIALATCSGFVTASRGKLLYLATGCAAAAFSLVVGGSFFLGLSEHLPHLTALAGFALPPAG